MKPRYGVIVDASALPRAALQSLAQQLTRESDIHWNTDELATMLARGRMQLVAQSTQERAQALRDLMVAGGGIAQLVPCALDGTLIGAGPLASAPFATTALPSNSSPALRGLDALDEGALVMLDGSEEDAASMQHTTRNPAPAPGVSVDDSRFRPPDMPSDPSESHNALELDRPVAAPTPTSSSPALLFEDPPAVDDGHAEYASPDEPSAESAPPSAERRPAVGPLLAASTARRQRSALGIARTLRQHPHWRLILGFALALGLGAIVPMCHARSVMSTTVAALRVELSTAKTHGVYATPAFSSVEQIEDRISNVKTRQGMFSLFLWLAGGGLCLFLWFRLL